MMIKQKVSKGRPRLTKPALKVKKNEEGESFPKIIPLPATERNRLISKRFGKTMHIKEILDYMRENGLYPERPA
jgi:hypothetical protein